MNLTEAFNLIENDDLFKQYIEIIPKRNKKTKIIYLEALNHLSYILYINGDENISKKLLEIICQIPFEGDYNYWTFIEHSIVLMSFIERNNVDKLKLFKGLILNTLEYGTESKNQINRNVHNRFLAGTTLESRIKEIENSPNLLSATEYRFSYLGDLFKLRLFIADSNFSENEIMVLIDDQICSIRSFIEINGFSDLFPFKAI